MDAKLTLKLRSDVIARAKVYAKGQGTSLSGLVERYFEVISNESADSKDNISPFVKSLGGSPLPENFDERKEYRNYIGKKHG